ncbi:hypothetical protein M9H77_36340 [Catharanthus roseus]|uniref:Uncharacterized protein n=1 Tax=Catharanthus roseus TaxID=4058 RepID=A0ACB9ZV95_CATRO|nr:hypothetical protein M9H77_36340 [Catharanthus roseus]
MSVISKILGSRNKRPDKASDVPASIQRKRVKASNWEQTGSADGGPIDPKLIQSYGGHDHGLLKCRSHYMALTGWSLIDAEVAFLASRTSLMHLRSCMFQHPNTALLSVFV